MLFIKLICVVVIGFMKGMLEMVSVVEVVIIVMMFGLLIRLWDRMVYIMRILCLKFLMNSGWIGWLIRCVVRVFFLVGCVLCLKKLSGILLVV